MWSNAAFTTRLSLIYLMLACSSQVYARLSFHEYQKPVDLSTEDSMLGRAYESHDEIHMLTKPVEMYAIPNVTAEEAELDSSINELKSKKNSDLKRQTQQILPCVKTESDLRLSVKTAPNGTGTNITLCAATIFLSDDIDPIRKITGIDITNKVINLFCGLPSNTRCTLDGADRSRIFFGKNVTLSVVNTNFVKGSSSNDCNKCPRSGGAIFLTGNSSLLLDRSSFMNNRASGIDLDYGNGGAIYVKNSSLVIKGGSARSAGSIFTKNYAWRGGAISAHFSTITFETGIVIFRDNRANFKSGAINIADSNATLKNVKFYNNEAEKASHFFNRYFHLYVSL